MYTCVYIDYILQESHNEKYDADSKEIEAPTKYPLHSLQNEKLKNKKCYIPWVTHTNCTFYYIFYSREEQKGNNKRAATLESDQPENKDTNSKFKNLKQ